jgi:acyl-CoA reductase-like NAD-dependent aldehyde dehydrogenase
MGVAKPQHIQPGQVRPEIMQPRAQNAGRDVAPFGGVKPGGIVRGSHGVRGVARFWNAKAYRILDAR